MNLFGSSGIRTTFNQDLLSLGLKVGLALGYHYDSILVGGDTRTSTTALKSALKAGILAAGSECFDSGVVPTPTVAFVARNFSAGAMITASHNPPDYNGIKFWNPDGSAFDLNQQRQIEETVSADGPATALWRDIKHGGDYPYAVEQHQDRIRQDFPEHLNIKAVVDTAGGAASLITPHLLKEMGCEVISLNAQPTGFFPRDTEPVEGNLTQLMRATREVGADIGIAHDSDGDRMMAVDELGQYVSGDKLLIILARDLGVKELVTTVDASMLVEEMGFRTRRTRVGDSFVSSEMKNAGQFGGEPSGAWIFPSVSFCPDGIYAAARIADIARRHKLSALAGEIPEFPLMRTNVATNGVAFSKLKSRLESLNPRSVDDFDGIKLNFDDGWLLVRPSGTEPKIRITIEARDASRMNQLHDESLRLITEGK